MSKKIFMNYAIVVNLFLATFSFAGESDKLKCVSGVQSVLKLHKNGIEITPQYFMGIGINSICKRSYRDAKHNSLQKCLHQMKVVDYFSKKGEKIEYSCSLYSAEINQKVIMRNGVSELSIDEACENL